MPYVCDYDQVMLMFGLENAPCCGELLFMERYQEVLVELGQVEQKIESQSLSSLSSSTEGLGSTGSTGPGRSRLGSSSRLTLQSIGNAAAAGFIDSSIFSNYMFFPMIVFSIVIETFLNLYPAGMAFYSISDVADRLLSTPSQPLPCLEENYWLTQFYSDPDNLLRPLLEELSPAGMAAFDLACCHCQLWKTSRTFLEMAERRMHTSLESRGAGSFINDILLSRCQILSFGELQFRVLEN